MAGLKIGQYIADPKPQTDGVWIVFDEEQGVEFKIAYIGNRRYEDKYTKLSMAARRRHRGRDLPPHIASNVLNEAVVGTILLGWKGLKDEVPEKRPDGALPLPPGAAVKMETVDFNYSEANALRLLKESKIFRDFIMEESMNLDNFQKVVDVESERGDSGVAGDLKSLPKVEP